MSITDTTTLHPVKPSTLRVRRHRERRRSGMRLFTVEVPEATIGDTITRGLLPKEGTKPWTVIQACYAGLLSDATLDWLITAGIITRDQRGDAAAIFRNSWEAPEAARRRQEALRRGPRSRTRSSLRPPRSFARRRSGHGPGRRARGLGAMTGEKTVRSRP